METTTSTTSWLYARVVIALLLAEMVAGGGSLISIVFYLGNGSEARVRNAKTIRKIKEWQKRRYNRCNFGSKIDFV
jgi:hypothetical protein